MKEAMNKVMKELNKNPDFIGFYKCSSNDSEITIQIIDYSHVENLFYIFKRRLYYALRNISIIESVINNPDLSKVSVKMSDSIELFYDNILKLKVIIKVF
jgi:hypothetical protein